MLRQVSENQADAKARVVEKIATTLSLLLPKKIDPRLMLVKIVAQAVVLANLMAEEQSLFWCFLAEIKTEPRGNDLIKVVDETQTGRVLLCTFPGLGRRIVDDGQEGFVCMVKANAELESSFDKNAA